MSTRPATMTQKHNGTSPSFWSHD